MPERERVSSRGATPRKEVPPTKGGYLLRLGALREKARDGLFMREDVKLAGL